MENKKLVLIVSGVVIVILAGVAFFLTRSSQTPADSVPQTTSYGTDSPLDKKPDLNPADKTNPFTDIKTNPFE